LATGGTAKAAAQLIESGGAEVVGFGFILALDFLNGSEKISQYPIHSLRTIYA
jgi:adenine phosphoribosyltransferase